MVEQTEIKEAPRTVEAKKQSNPLKRIFSVLGPGLITGASDDDPSGIITYAQAGAQFGLLPLWTAFFTFPLMSSVQYICSKIGLVTGKSLTVVIRQNYPRWLLLLTVSILVIANTINAGADIGAIAAGVRLVVPEASAKLLVMPITAAILVFFVFGSYSLIVRVFKWLTLALFAYIASCLLTHPNWAEVAEFTFVPHVQWTEDYLSLLVAILGTTISPYLFFWQTQAEVEEQRKEGVCAPGATGDDLKYAAWDVNAGMLFSNVVMFFIILASAGTLHVQGVKEVLSAQQAAQALKPVGGQFATWLFASGLIGTGVLAVPILVGSAAYALAAAFGWRRGLDEKWHRAREFYGIIAIATGIGMTMNFLNLNAMTMLYWTAILNGLLAPPLLVLIMLISNNRKIMCEKTNSKLVNILGWLATGAMSVAAIALLATSVPKGS
jgi:NRAMP (natural resistance-associated macrophage protein)-like metal ion transporter